MTYCGRCYLRAIRSTIQPPALTSITSNDYVPATSLRSKILALNIVLHVGAIVTVFSDFPGHGSNILAIDIDLMIKVVADKDSCAMLATDTLATALTFWAGLTLTQSGTTVGIVRSAAQIFGTLEDKLSDRRILPVISGYVADRTLHDLS